MDESPKFFYYLGGRKMALALLAIFIGGMVEMHTEHGISVAFVTLLLGIVGAFTISNVVNTVKTGNADPSDAVAPGVSHQDMDEVKAAYQKDMGQVTETFEKFSNALTETNKRVNTLLSLAVKK